MGSSSGNNDGGTSTTDDDDVVILGPDLNPTRSKMDKKLYRHITLQNGMQCVLICDTVAMRQRKAMGCCDDESDSESDDEEDEGDYGGNKDDDENISHSDESSEGGSSEEGDDDDDGLRKAATALLVNVGSYHDPPYLQGIAHFLEHMLFLGTEDFPMENAYDSFLSQQGGDDNAYTGKMHGD